MNLAVVNKVLPRIVGNRASLILRAKSPEILLVAGIGGVIGSTVMACRATLKVEEVVDDAKCKIDKINDVWASTEVPTEKYTDKDRKKDLTIVYTQTAVKFARLYGPPIVLGAASIGCIIGGHNIMRKRNVALMAAYKAVDEGFRQYRQRVIDEYGEEKDYMLRHGLRAETIVEEETGANGKSKNVKKTKYAVEDPNAVSQYARFFDECSTQWNDSAEYNLFFLRAQQNYFNDMLQVRKHVFLNEVYDALGIPRSSAGSVVGWMIGKGDDFIDFGIWDGDDQIKREFVNGYERSILLDFNVDGVIYDLI